MAEEADQVPLSEQPEGQGQNPQQPQQQVPPQKGPAIPWLFNRIPPQVWLPTAVALAVLAIVLPIILTLPQNISCAPDEYGYYIVNVLPPQISKVTPSVACLSAVDQTLEIQGVSFIIWNEAPPIVTLGDTELQITGFDNCNDLSVRGQNAKACSTIYVQLPQFSGGNLQIVNLTISWPHIDPPHPAASTQGVPCSTTRPLVVAPPPTLSDIRPPVLCNQTDLQDVYLEGNNFLVVYDFTSYNTPSVSVNNELLNQASLNFMNCTTIQLPGQNVDVCKTVVASIQTSTLSGQRNTITVTNPTFSGCEGTTTTEFLVLPPPLITGVSPSLICASNSSNDIIIRGSDFIMYDNNNPVVSVNDALATVVSTAGCSSSFTVRQHTVRVCSEIQVTIPSQLPYLQSVGPFVPLITVTPPFLPTCIAKTDVLTVAPAPVITKVVPLALCIYQNTTQSITLMGNGFLFSLDKPRVYINNVFAPIVDQNNCSVVSVNNDVLGFCLELNVTLTPSLFGLGDLLISVLNPPPYPCSANTTGILSVVTAPVVTDVNPKTLCSGVTSITLTITGNGFDQNSQVLLIRNCIARPPTCDRTYVGTVTSVSSTQIVATFDTSLGIPPDYYILQVSTFGLCAQVNSTFQLAIAPPLLILFADPQVIYNAFPNQVTLFCSGLVSPPAQVTLYNNVTSLTLPVLTNVGETNPNKVHVLLPANLTVGEWYIRIETIEGCVTSLVNPLLVTNQLTINLELINPAYVWTGVSTDVTIKAFTTGAAFVPYPRVYISPRTSNSTLIQLSAVDILDSYTLASSIPPNTPVGSYDLIVVNPTGEVGFLANALNVTANPPPHIEYIVPLYYTANRMSTGVIIGSGFSTVSVTLQVQCLFANGNFGFIRATGTPQSPTSVSATFDFTGVSSGAYCVVKVSNPDGEFSLFSAITTKSPSGNLVGWVPTAPTFINMRIARRGHALIVGKATNTNQFLYALGGDNGVKDQNTQTLERAPIDIFGNLGSFTLVPYNYLPQGRTFTAAITLGRFIYVVGGYWNVDGITALSSCIRAEILNPKEIPFVTATILLIDSGTSQFTAGYWLYAVSAIFGLNDPRNPRGESLRSDILAIYLPASADRLQVQLSWTPVPRAVGYRIYRTPAPNMNATSLSLLIEINSPSTTVYIDSGEPVDGITTPLTIGTLGKWQNIPGLNTAREGLALAVGQDPVQTELWYLYALFGRDSNGVYLNTYEILTINTSTPNQPWIGGWREQVAYVNGFGSAIARADCGAVAATSRDTGSIPVNQTWIYIPGGSTTGNVPLSSNLLAAQVQPGGNLTFNQLICNSNPCSTSSFGQAYCTIQATGVLYLMGGYGNNNVATNGGGSNVIGTPPSTLQQSSFNSLGGGGLMSVNRAYAACTYESSKLWISGGFSGNVPGPVTASVQYSIQ